jgi:polyisoprenyl-teichoic acid--peptidoglycan teichoic acid transferase
MQNNWTPDDQQTLTNNRPVTFPPPDEQATVTNIPPVPSVPAYEPRRPERAPMVSATRVNGTTTYYNDVALPPPPPSTNGRDSAARDRVRRRRVSNRHSGGEWAWVVIALTLLGVVVIVSMSAFVMLKASQAEPEYIATAAAVLPTPVDARGNVSINGTPVQQLTLNDGRSIELIPWDGNSRFTVLVVGLDRRPGETGLAYRTDTMMLVSIDPASKSLGILSIPRDLYVEVPGYSELQRVNSPMVLGELRQPGFGPELMMQTVQYNLGIRVHDYVAVDFNTFIQVIDTIGGVDIDVPYTISDSQYPDMNYGYDPFYIQAGQQHLDGLTALKYARTRHGDNDFQRAQRQQQVLYAVRDKILDLDMLPQLIVQAPTLWNDLSTGISTGLTFDQIIQLILYLKDIPSENTKTGVIDENYTIGYTTSQGASVLVPDRAQLGPLMVEVFGANYSQ